MLCPAVPSCALLCHAVNMAAPPGLLQSELELQRSALAESDQACLIDWILLAVL